MQFVSKSDEETKKIAKKIFEEFLTNKKVLLICGDFGVGKTVFVKGLAKALGICENEVRSPSFTLLREYSADDRTLIHCDLYRIRSNSDLQFLDLESYYKQDNSLLVIEWAQNIKDWNFDNMMRLEMKIGKNEERIILITSVGK